MPVTQAQTWAHDYEGNDFLNELGNFDELDPTLAAVILTGWDPDPMPNQRRFAHNNARAHEREEWVRSFFFAQAGIGSAWDLNCHSLTEILSGLV